MNDLKKNQNTYYQTPINLALIGAGIMSVTLATFIKILQPNYEIHMYERLGKIAQESSNAWNNAGTGHSSFCELNYTNKKKDGSIDISKAIEINESFEISRQFWSYLTKTRFLNNPQTFINNIPHMSFVWGEHNTKFLRYRFNKLQQSILFHGMQYSEDPKKINEWAPLIMEGRDASQKIAATYMEIGTDIDFGEIIQQLVARLKNYPNFHIYLQHDVTSIKENVNNTWLLHITDNKKNKKTIYAERVFIGAGGQSLSLLRNTGIKKINGYAGFPVGGQFLFTNNQKIIERHEAKIYGKAPMYAPPMSVPHIDTRIINGSKFLLFGPFATFSGKFLKFGSQFDILRSLNYKNLLPILEVSSDNLQLIKYLIKQLIMSHKKKYQALCEYYPNARSQDWSLLEAGQRVQIIKKDKKNRGMLQFGTEIINSPNGTLSALLGASPGASTSAAIILNVLNTLFKEQIKSELWKKKLKEIIPSYNRILNEDIILTNTIRKEVCDTLKLKNIISTLISIN